MSGLPSFSKVDVSKLDFSEIEDEEPKRESAPMRQGLSMGEMEGMMGGMGGMAGFGAGDDPDDWKVTMMDEADVGKELDCSRGEKKVMKKLLRAGRGYENPKQNWEVVLTAERKDENGLNERIVATDEDRIIVGSDRLPSGLTVALKTMRKGETALVTLRGHDDADRGDSAAQSASGAAADAAIQYEVQLERIVEVAEIEDGKIVKKTLREGEGYEALEDLWRARTRVSGRLASSGQVFWQESEFSFTAGDPSLPAFWALAVVGKMKKRELAELTVSSDLAWGEKGDASIGVPPNADVVINVELEDWVEIVDLSASKDRSLLKSTLAKGEGWERARERFECDIDLQVTRGDEVLIPSERSVFSVGEERAALNEICGDVAPKLSASAALSKLLKNMQVGETAELRLDDERLGSAKHGADTRFKATLHSYLKVEEVPHTNLAVTKKVLHDPTDMFDRPNEDSLCKVAFKVFTVDESGVRGDLVEETELTDFVQGERKVLPCIDAAVREMKKGERSVISAPAEWAYGSVEFEATEGVDRPRSRVEVELELLDFVKAKDAFEMDISEKLAMQAKKKEQGNQQFKRGLYKEAVKKYETSNRFAPGDADFQKAEVPESELVEMRAGVLRQRVACFVNIANAQTKLGDHNAAITSCTSALELDRDNVKALFRRGEALLAADELERAKSDLLAAARAAPKDRQIRQLLEGLKAKQAAQKSKDKRLFGGMFA